MEGFPSSAWLLNTVESRKFEVKGTKDLISNYRKFEL